MLRILLAFCLLTGFIDSGLAAKLPFLTDTLTGEQKNNLPVPSPTALQAGWWHYFEIEGEELRNRVQTTLNQLDTQLATLEGDIAEKAMPFAALVKANLNALPGARAEPALRVPAPPAYGETYRLDQLLQLAKKLRDTQTELDAERIDVAAATSAIQNVAKRVDDLFVAYLKLAESDPDLILRGLEIMAERLSLIVAAERLRLRKAEWEVTQVRVKQLVDEQAIASQRLTAEVADLFSLERQIEAAGGELEQAKDNTVQAQARATRVLGNRPEEKAAAFFREQVATKALVGESIARVKLTILQAQYYVSLLLLDRSYDSQKWRKQLAEWRRELTQTRQQITSWIAASERERQRTGAATADAQPETADEKTTDENAAVVAQLNQDRFRTAQETLVQIQALRDSIIQAALVIELVDDQLRMKEGRLRDWLAWSWQRVQQSWAIATSWFETSLFKVGDTPVTSLGLFRIAFFLAIAWLISYWLRRALQRLGERGDGSNLPAFYTVGRLSHYVLILIGFLLGLSSIGMDFTNFALVAGALAIGIGFGLQAIVNNFISGLILLFERSLKVGDFVQLASGVTGEVQAINVRSTQIKTNENIDIVVPNSEFMNSNVVNWTLQEPFLRVHYPFRVAYGMDKDLVRKAGLEAAENVPHTLSGIPGKNPQVWLVGFGENGFSFELVVWLTASAAKRPNAVRAAYYWALETALQKYAIEVPVPQRDLRLRAGLEELVEEKDSLGAVPASRIAS